MNYELFFGGIAAFGFAYLAYKSRRWSTFIPIEQYYETAGKLNMWL